MFIDFQTMFIQFIFNAVFGTLCTVSVPVDLLQKERAGKAVIRHYRISNIQLDVKNSKR